MKVSSLAALPFALLALAACAPAPSGAGSDRATVTTAPNASPQATAAVAKYPLKSGERWRLVTTFADGDSKEFTIEISEAPYFDADDEEVYAEAIANDRLEAYTAYDPADELLAIVVYQDRSSNPKLAYCDLRNARAGQVRMRGLSFQGTSNELRQALRGPAEAFGDCQLSRQ